MKNYLRDILSDTRGSILFFILGLVIGAAVSSLYSVNNEIERLQKEYNSNRNLIDTCFLNPNVPLPSHSDFNDDDDYRPIFRKDKAR